MIRGRSSLCHIKRFVLVVLVCLACHGCEADETAGAIGIEARCTETVGAANEVAKLEELIETAEGGNAAEMFAVYAHISKHPEILNECFDLGIDYLAQSAVGDYAEAQFILGYMMNSGRVISRNIDAGIGWLIRAAEQGHFDAQKALGGILVNLANATDDLNDKQEFRSEAIRWLRHAVDAGDLTSKSLLGGVLIRDSDTRVEGERLLREAAHDGSESAKKKLIILDDLIADSEKDAAN